jgi:tRNA-specific adenosine deaminase 3
MQQQQQQQRQRPRRKPVFVPGTQKPSLVLQEVLVARVAPQTVGTLINRLAKDLPLNGLRHLKRVRKAQGAMEVVLCSLPSGAAPPQPEQPLADYLAASPAVDIPAAVAATLQQVGAQLGTAQVPRHAPVTREDLEAWARAWPMYWRVPDASHSTATYDPTPEEEAQMAAHVEHLLQHGAGAANAALVVDAASNEVIALARDDTHTHPLRHAVMAAIDAVAQRDLLLWPGQQGEFAHSRRSDWLPEEQGQQGVAEGRGEEAHAGCKRPRLSEHAAAAAASAAGPSGSGRAIAGGSAGPAAGAAAGAAGAAGAAAAAAAAVEDPLAQPGKQYLCTGYDCYVLHEPCVMCAMALVHSRVRRVVYCEPDAQLGALGGRIRLHGQKSLNHHYQVFSAGAEEGA